MKIGLTLPNRGVLFGVTTPEQMLQMAEIADRRRTSSSRSGSATACSASRGWSRSRCWPASPPARSASGSGRPAWRACRCAIRSCSPTSGPASTCWPRAGRCWSAAPASCRRRAAGSKPSCTTSQPKDRVGRLVEWITLIKRLWTEDNVTFEGEHYRCSNVTIEPKPAAKPRPPIWIANNAQGSRTLIERTHQRAVDHADGWETSLSDVDDLRWRLEDIRDRVQRGRIATRRPSRRTCTTTSTSTRTARRRWTSPSGSWKRTTRWSSRPRASKAGRRPARRTSASQHLLAYKEMGFGEVTLRITGWDQFGQLDRVMNEVLPRVLE